MDTENISPNKKADIPYAYDVIEKIGSGTYGNVFLCKHKVTGELVAIKRIHFHDQDEGYPPTALREISLLKDLKHRSIIPLKEIINTTTKLHIVLEYMNYDLKTRFDHHMAKDEYFTRDVVKIYMYQLLEAVAYMHGRRYLHRDIKPGNILLSGLRLKLGDFGLARSLTEPVRPYTEEVSTQWYRAPEIMLLKGEYGAEADVWSCACVFFELITKDGLFKGDSDIDQLYKISDILGSPSVEEWPDLARAKIPIKFDNRRPRRELLHLIPHLNIDDLAYDLLLKMLVYNPQYRLSAAMALKHPYFDSLRNVNLDEILNNSQGVALTESLHNIQEAFNNEVSDLNQ